MNIVALARALLRGDSESPTNVRIGEMSKMTHVGGGEYEEYAQFNK